MKFCRSRELVFILFYFMVYQKLIAKPWQKIKIQHPL